MKRTSTSRRRPGVPLHRASNRPRLEALEDRLLLSISLVPSPPSPHLVGQLITWTATDDSGGSDLVYQFGVGPRGGPLRVVRDFSADHTFTWAPMQQGAYDVGVTVKEGIQATTTTAAVVSDTVTSRVTGTDPVVTPTANPLVALYSAPPGSAGTVRVNFRPASSPDAPWMSTDTKPSVPGQSTNFLVAGMLANTTYEMVGVTGNGYLAPVYFTTGSPPADLVFPDFTVVQGPGPGSDPSQNMVLHFAALGAPPAVNVLATDLAGRVDWYYDPVAAGLTDSLGTSLVPGGTVLLLGNTSDPSFGLDDNVLREVDLAGNTVRETNVDAVNTQLVARGQPTITGFHHDAERLPNGDTALLAHVQETVDVGGTPTDYVGDMVIVLDQNFQVKWTWNAFNYLDTNRLPTDGEGPDDWLHSNSVSWSPADGDLIVSVRHLDWVIKIDYRNGAGDGHVVWRLGKGGDFTTDSSDPYPWFSHQHNAHYLDDGTLILFDNGNTRVHSGDPGTPDSRGQVWSLNEQTMQATLRLNADLGNYSFALGSAQKLPNGNYVFTSGFQGTYPNFFGQSIEVLPDGAPTYVLQSASLEYRSYQMSDLYGQSALDGQPPTVQSVAPSDPSPTTASVVHFTVVFDQIVQGVDPGAFSVSTGGTLAGAAVVSVTPVSGSVYSVAVNTGSGSGDLGLNVLANGHIRNAFGVPLAAGASSGAASYSVNRPPPGGHSDPPSVDLNGAAPGIDYATAFSQNGPPVLVVGPSMTVADPSSPTLASATVTITNRQDGALERLSADTTGTGITANYNAAGGVLTLTGTDTLAHYQQVLRTVRYNNVSTSPGIVPDRRITFTVSDGTLTSATAVTTLKVRATDKIGAVRPDGRGSLVFSLDTNGNGVFDAGDQVFHFGLPGDTVIVGDWNGDGRSKVGVVRPDGKGSLVFSLDTNGDGVFDAGDQVFHFGLPGDTVIVGDWNGDGRSKIGAVRQTASGVLSFSLDTNGTGFFDASSTVLSFGLNRDAVVIGDWNGDGRSKVGVVRGAPDGTATFLLDTNGTGIFDASDLVFHFGLAGDQFLVGDWNADGRGKVGVVRGAPDGTAVVSLDTVGNGTFNPAEDQVFRFGLADDTFVVGKWRP
jgi:arylsulfate sulfotransferase